MQRKIRRAPRPFAFKALTALTVAAAFSNVYAAGLGKLTVLSALGQPLRAEIELTSVSRDEAGSIAAKLASAQAFKQANVDFNPALMSLRFAIEQRGSRQVIRVTSTQPINEPYVGMLIELSSNNGRLLREYTFLLDPPELRQTQVASAASAPVVSELPAAGRKALPDEQPLASDRIRPSRKVQKSNERRKDVDDKAGGSGEYRVRKGDTLGSIAGRLRHDGVSLDQMLVSIYRANPDAFIGNNMNRLKSGKVMSIPDAAAVSSISQSEARGVIVAQSNDFEQYRHKLAGAVAQTPAQQAEQSSQAAGGKITAKVEEQPSAVSKSVDRLKLAKENAGAPEKPAAVVSTEDKLSSDKSIADNQARIRELEKNIKELQGLLDLKSKDLAVHQKQVEAASAPKPAEAGAGAQAPAAVPPVAAQQPQPQPPKPATKPKTVAPPPPPPSSSFMDDVLDSPTMLGGIAAAVIGFVYLLWSRIRRRKQAEEMTNKFMAEHPIAESPNSLFGTTGGQSINTNNSVFNSSFSPSAMQVDANEVDPVAEADVYIAYGREAQAIEILKDALRAQPERNAVRIKLLEIYASQNDILSFDTLASDLYALTKGEGEDWAYAAKMGASIDPKNPLYTDSDVLEEIADKPASIHSFTNPLEELDPDSLTAPSRHAQESAELGTDDKAAEPELAIAAADADQWADLPLDIGGADTWQDTRPATAEEQPQPKSEPENLLDWPVETDKSENMLQEQLTSASETPQSAFPSTDEPLEFESVMKVQQPDETSDILKESVALPELADLSAADLAGISLDLGQTEKRNEMPEQMEDLGVDVAAESPNAALPELQIESKSMVAAAESAADANPLEFDFASINLDLGTSDLSDKKSSGFGESSVSIEMATKLDLAVAYMEIGDKEGARELLEEVIKGGSEEQVAKARETLTKIK